MSGVPLWYAVEAQHGREYSSEPENRDDPPVLVAFPIAEHEAREAVVAAALNAVRCYPELQQLTVALDNLHTKAGGK